MIDPDTGQPLTQSGPTWTSIFADEMLQIGRDETDVVAITAAMLGPTGLERFAASYPDRTYDVGIAEQHAATSAAGLAYGGLHPVVAVYATFLNRAFDQVLMDCALHTAGVTFVLDRAGVTGDDGPSHNGMWDMAMLGIVPAYTSRPPAMSQPCAVRSGSPSRSPTHHRWSVLPRVLSVRTSRPCARRGESTFSSTTTKTRWTSSSWLSAVSAASRSTWRRDYEIRGSRPVSSTHGGRYRSPRTLSR